MLYQVQDFEAFRMDDSPARIGIHVLYVSSLKQVCKGMAISEEHRTLMGTGSVIT